jgi:hypothetical protein
VEGQPPAEPNRTPPPEVLDALRERQGIPPPWSPRVLRLSGLNPTFRVESAAGSWIVKRSADPRKDLVVADLFRGWSIPTFGVEVLLRDWLAMEDLRLPTLAEHVQREAASRELFGGLGAAAAQAERVGMRDRKIANILVDGAGAAGPRLIHIDYEGAFCAGLFDRAVRPWRYVTYLVRRFFVDVLEAAPPGTLSPGGTPSPFESFREGLLREHERLERLAGPRPPTRFPLALRQRITLRTRIGSRRLESLLAEFHRRPPAWKGRVNGPSPAPLEPAD